MKFEVKIMEFYNENIIIKKIFKSENSSIINYLKNASKEELIILKRCYYKNDKKLKKSLKK